jgi:hypothetical protein
MNKIFIRCSSLSKVMGQCKEMITELQLEALKKYNEKGDDLTTKQKTDRTKLQKKKDNPPVFDLSEGAKTYVRTLVREENFGGRPEIDTNEMKKGTMVEDDVIELYNLVNWTKYKKNEVRLFNDHIQGECDIDSLEDDLIIDIKSSWSLNTFPFLPDEINVGGYEWQGRGYMMLYDRSKFKLCYGLVDTPDELLDYEEDLTIHHVNKEIEPEIRLTELNFRRCSKKEAQIKHKVNECRKYATWYYQRIADKHSAN